MEQITTTTGLVIYRPFSYPESLDGLDREIVRNTLDYQEFLANMSDDYRITCQEIEQIYRYRRAHGL